MPLFHIYCTPSTGNNAEIAQWNWEQGVFLNVIDKQSKGQKITLKLIKSMRSQVDLAPSASRGKLELGKDNMCTGHNAVL